MIAKRRFVHKLRELGYDFKEQLHYQERYRKRGGTHIIHIPRRDQLDEEFCRITLKQSGVSKTDIESFMLAAKV